MQSLGRKSSSSIRTARRNRRSLEALVSVSVSDEWLVHRRDDRWPVGVVGLKNEPKRKRILFKNDRRNLPGTGAGLGAGTGAGGGVSMLLLRLSERALSVSESLPSPEREPRSFCQMNKPNRTYAERCRQISGVESYAK